jgi:hypothetical protein
MEQPVAQLLRLSDGVFAVEEQGADPGEKADADQGQLEPGGVDGEQAGGEPAEAGVFAGADAVLDPGMAAAMKSTAGGVAL